MSRQAPFRRSRGSSLPQRTASTRQFLPAYGEYLVSQILETLVSNPDVWASTVFLVLYDENGGFFDHMAPPTPGPLATLTNGVVPPFQ